MAAPASTRPRGACFAGSGPGETARYETAIYRPRRVCRGGGRDGGACACATCQVYVAPGWEVKLPPKSEMEETMLDFAPEVKANSRLSCQLRMCAELDGIVLNLPKAQQ